MLSEMDHILPMDHISLYINLPSLKKKKKVTEQEGGKEGKEGGRREGRKKRGRDRGRWKERKTGREGGKEEGACQPGQPGAAQHARIGCAV